ncbi:hypothetical protein NL676_031852 [Syzygium grande]|nr:hypothetical protein NL676_031852 [Syzygium grande]
MPSKRKSGGAASSASAKRGKAEKPREAPAEELEQQQQLSGQVKERINVADGALATKGVTRATADGGGDGEESECRFLGAPIPNEEARQKWPKRYLGLGKKKKVVNVNGNKE